MTPSLIQFIQYHCHTLCSTQGTTKLEAQAHFAPADQYIYHLSC